MEDGLSKIMFLFAPLDPKGSFSLLLPSHSASFLTATTNAFCG